MRVISLTSIPPRFDTLGPTLESLLAQGADRVVLALPETFRRFPGPVTIPSLPEGVTVLRCAKDHGPITKLLPALEAFPTAQIALCDDDCLYAPGWLSALEAAWVPGAAVAGSVWSVKRLRRQGRLDGCDIAQGFAGTLVSADLFNARLRHPPPVAWPVDDLWISGNLAHQGVTIHLVPDARHHVAPNAKPPASLQDAIMEGRGRAEANRACADWMHRTLGIWPPRA